MPDENASDEVIPRETTNKNQDQRLEAIRHRAHIDAKFGYQPYTESTPRDAWLINVQQAEVFDEQTKSILAAVELYFLEEDGSRFKIPFLFRPYFYLETNKGQEYVVANFLSRKYHFVHIEHVEKENLDLKNHLAGLHSKFLRVSFPSTAEMAKCKRDLMPQIRKNRLVAQQTCNYTEMLAEYMGSRKAQSDDDPLEQIIDIREHDLPFDVRVAIDQHFFVGHWYTVVGRDPSTQAPSIQRNTALVDPPEPIICAFDIETTKAPLKFPEATIDKIMMISYMIDDAGFLIINREIVSADIENFEYTPKPEFRGEFTVFNEPDERAVLNRFFGHLLRVRPHIMVTYNGDNFDWPFVDARAASHGILLASHLGFFKDSQDEYKHPNCIHMDAFRWVQRDSYLPMGSQSLKAATREKLQYEPVEVDPEEMVPMAREQPRVLASYSVSDAVSTYYLYLKFVHPFIFALCTIIPLAPDDVLRKGTGSLCEALLMVQAQRDNIIFPNKQVAKEQRMTEDGHLILSDTYVGGHVEALESGVFRADIPCRFKLDVDALEQLKEDVPSTVEHTLRNDAKVTDLEEVPDFDVVCAQIKSELQALIERPLRTECPKIYHLDVGAMYPNIILTNRLQPPAMVTEEECMACIHNTPDAKCKRPMQWVWRGEIIPASRGEYEMMMLQLEKEKFGKERRPFNALPREERDKIAKERVKEYCRNAYKRLHDTREEQRTTTICQREHPFYVDTVRAFRDRRYEYKEMLKKAKAALAAVPADDLASWKQAQSRVVLYDSLQLAHKCLLNSFYGYVMRKGSRWFSMEMAGIVCHTGANIITEARQLIERVGRPLELDTDGIWCLLPTSFPETFIFHNSAGKTLKISYPGAVLNALVKDRFTNEQYHVTDPKTGECTISSENSIFFEVDGPYYAMILPASKEEGKKLKKRYAVFNFDGSLAELKGFEVKRRGELAIIKYFQTEVFKCFLKGSTLQEIYENVAREANYWLNILQDKGETLSRRELFELIGESKSMSRQLEDYGEQKSTSISTAKRLAEFLGADMVKNKGLACDFVVSRFPFGDPVSERTIPLVIFDAATKDRVKFLRRWTKGASLKEEFSSDKCLKELIDWQYYTERLSSSIQKIITIPAALQGIPNPVPRVAHPQWLENKRRERIEMHTQPRITDLFKSSNGATVRTPGSGRKGRGGGVQSTPWSLRKKRAPSETNKLITTEEGPSVRKRPLTEIGGRQSAAKRICTDAGEDVVVIDCEGSEGSQKENRPDVTTTAKEITDDPVNCDAFRNYNDLIDLDTLLGEENGGGGDGDRGNPNGKEKQKEMERRENGEGERRQRTTEMETVNPMKKRSRAQLQREARKAAVAQHSSRRFPRHCYDTTQLQKRTWKADGFMEWLNFLKTKWRLQRQARTAAFNAAVFQNAVENGEGRGQDESSTASNLTTAAITLARRETTWHIVQILESRIPGKYTMFALVDGTMRRVGLNVPRIIYVDDIEPRQTAVGRLTQKVLPRQRPCAYLYEFSIDELLFDARMTDLNTEMCLWRINGVYETRAPLLFKALVHTGLRCHVERGGGGGDVQLEAITRIERPSTSACPSSTPPDLSRFRLLFLYEYHVVGRSVLTIFMPSTGRAHYFIVNRAPLDLRNLDTLYTGELQKFLRQKSDMAETDFPGMTTECQRIQSMEAVQCSTPKETARRLQALLNTLKWAPTEAAILCTQSNRSPTQFYKDFPFLRAFAAVRIRVQEPPGLLNVLDWANAMARRSIQHFFNSFTYLKEYWSISAYSEIPIGNLPEDVPSLALDTLFARALQSKNHLLWASPSSVPDFGGKELEDWRLGNDWESAAFTEARPYVLNKETFEANFITAELSLGAVAVTALLQSARIAEAEGTSEQTGFAASASAQPTTMSIEDALSHRLLGLSKYDNTMAVGGVLRCLREVFHRLVRDIHLYENVFADQLVVNMHRWISDPNSLLFHPSLCSTLLTLMRKLCLLLAAEVQRLGAPVLHCSFARLVLSTQRTTLPHARAFVDSLLASLAQRPLFASLQMQLKHFSGMLLWIDHANYAHVYASDDSRNGRVAHRFALAERIPEERGCRAFFSTAIAGFMGMLSQQRKREVEEDFSEESFGEFCVVQLTDEIVPSLFKLATRLVTTRPQLRKLATDYGCADVPLEFVNCICRVLSVVPALDEHVDRMRNQLLLILQQDGSSKELYGPLADWVPSAGVLLENVFCPKCAESADLDVAQPMSRHDKGNDGDTNALLFPCPSCDAGYPMSLIEEMLQERVAKMHTAFVLQDWRCTACKKMGAHFLARHCECSNPFEGTIKAVQFRHNMDLVRRVARKHGLDNLEQFLDYIFQCYD